MKSIQEISLSSVSITLISAIVVVLLPLDIILIKMSFSDFKSEYIGLTIKMALIFAISYLAIKKMKIENIIGISSLYKWEHKYLNLIPMYLIILGVLSILSNDLTQIKLGNLTILLLACLTVGFAEEFLFRGVVLSFFLKKYHTHKNGILLSTFYPALIFGSFHFLNLTKNDHVAAVIIQVVFATFIGFFFGVLVLKTNKIIPIAVTHGLINFFFSITFLPGVNNIDDANTSFTPIIVTLPLLISSIFIIKKIKKETIIKKLNT